MKKQLLLAALILFIATLSATAQQTLLDGRFLLMTNNGTDYDVKVQIKCNSATAQLGPANFYMSYNSSALLFSGTPLSGQDYTYHNFNSNPYNSNVLPPQLVSGKHVLALNITYGSIFNAQGTTVGQSWIDLVTLHFSILNTSGTSDLAWDTTLADIKGDTLGPAPGEGDWYCGTWSDLNTTPLPVELITFSGYDQDGRVHLHWETATEFENHGFEIQRQEEGREWTSVGFVPGKGTVNYPVIYDWDDDLVGLSVPRTFVGSLRYRLKQIDRDGTWEYSPVIKVAINAAADNPQLTVYPNPCVDQTTVAYTLQQAGSVTLTVHDASGREVLRVLDARDVERGAHVFTVPTSSLSNGMYVVRLLSGGGAYAQPFAIVR